MEVVLGRQEVDREPLQHPPVLEQSDDLIHRFLLARQTVSGVLQVQPHDVGLGGGLEAPVSPTGTVPPEASGEQVVGTIGAGVYLNPKLFLSLEVSYDNNHAVLFRPGTTFRSK